MSGIDDPSYQAAQAQFPQFIPEQNSFLEDTQAAFTLGLGDDSLSQGTAASSAYVNSLTTAYSAGNSLLGTLNDIASQNSSANTWVAPLQTAAKNQMDYELSQITHLGGSVAATGAGTTPGSPGTSTSTTAGSTGSPSLSQSGDDNTTDGSPNISITGIGNFVVAGNSITVSGSLISATGSNNTLTGNSVNTAGSDNNLNGVNIFGIGNTLSGNGRWLDIAGQNDTATGSYLLAVGSFDKVTGISDRTVGNSNTVSGNYDRAFGNNDKITGDYAAVLGDGLSASTGQLVFGTTSNYTIVNNLNQTWSTIVNGSLTSTGNGMDRNLIAAINYEAVNATNSALGTYANLRAELSSNGTFAAEKLAIMGSTGLPLNSFVPEEQQPGATFIATPSVGAYAPGYAPPSPLPPFPPQQLPPQAPAPVNPGINPPINSAQVAGGGVHLGIVYGGSSGQQKSALQGEEDDLRTYSQYYTNQDSSQTVPAMVVGTLPLGVLGVTQYGDIQLSDQNQDQNMVATAAHEFNHAETSVEWKASRLGTTLNINEATTDWLAQQAAGRLNSGPGSSYQNNDNKIQQAVDSGLISKDTIAKAYFSGDQNAISSVAAAYRKVGLI
jgi:hypothetical protein